MNRMFESIAIYIIPKEEKGSQKGDNDDMITITPYNYKVKNGRAKISHVKVSYRVKSNPSQAVNYALFSKDDLYEYICDLFRGTNLDTEPYDGINVLLPGFPNWMYSVYDEKKKLNQKIENVLEKNDELDSISTMIESYMDTFETDLDRRIQFVWGRIEKMMDGVWPSRHSLMHTNSDSDSETTNSSDSDSVESS
jgi:hypothetical protein